jgi:hypothetical protein
MQTLAASAAHTALAQAHSGAARDISTRALKAFESKERRDTRPCASPHLMRPAATPNHVLHSQL